MKSNEVHRLILVLAASATLSACVSTKTVSQTQIDDADLKCDSIAVRIGEVRSAKSYAKANQGVSGANVAAALFFWPALLVNNSNTSAMIKSMDQREATLTSLYESKSCSDAIPSYDNKEIKRKLKAGDTQESFS